eukprot:g35275.t1
MDRSALVFLKGNKAGKLESVPSFLKIKSLKVVDLVLEKLSLYGQNYGLDTMSRMSRDALLAHLDLRVADFDLVADVFGCTYDDIQDVSFRVHAVVKRHHEMLGLVFAVHQPLTPFSPLIFIADPDLVQEIMTSKVFPSRGKTGLQTIFPQGLLALPTGEKWRRHRRYVSPLFSERNLRSYAEIIEDKLIILYDRWRKMGVVGAKWIQIEVHSQLLKLTGDIISDIAFGMDMNRIRTGQMNQKT